MNEKDLNLTFKAYDNGGKTADRYTVIIHDHDGEDDAGDFYGGERYAVCMDENPLMPNGINMMAETHDIEEDAFGERIHWNDLPQACRVAVYRRIADYFDFK